MRAMRTDRSELGLLELHRQTGFVFDDRGRMIWETAPDHSRGSRFSLTGCRDGNLAVIRDDISESAAHELRRLVAEELPLSSPRASPKHLQDYLSVLEGEGPLAEPLFGLLWVFPGPILAHQDVHLVWSGTAEGEQLSAHFDEVAVASPDVVYVATTTSTGW